VELGLFKGETWYKVLPHCQSAYGVDVVDRNIKGNVHIMTTDQFFSKFPKDEKIDMAFIDADHSYESCKKDFFNCLERLSDGGVIIMHDTDPVEDSLFDQRRCGDSYKIVDLLERNYGDSLNIVTLPVAEAGVSIITKKGDTRVLLRGVE
jgi:predicted O-methyltransferase YrrM